MNEIFSDAMDFLDTILVAGQKHEKLTETEQLAKIARKTTLGFAAADDKNIFKNL